MLPASKLGLDGFELRYHPLLRRNPPNDEWSCRELSTEMRKAQKREGLGFPLATPLPSSRSKPPKLDQSCFIRMQFQTELCQPLPKFFQELLRICSVLEAHHQIVGITDDYHIASRHFLAPGFDPEVEHIMQVHVGEQRRNHGSLRRSYLCLRPLPIFRYSGLQPFLDQAKYPVIRHAVLDK